MDGGDEVSKDSKITHIAKCRSINFFLITEEQPIGSLEYSLKECLVQSKYNSCTYENIDDRLLIEEFKSYSGMVSPNHTFRNIKDMERFFGSLD